MEKVRQKFGWLYSLDSLYRRLDWRLNRTRGGMLENFPAFRGYSPFAILTFLLLLCILVLGPTARTTAFWAYSSLVVSLLAYMILAKALARRRVFWTQIVMIVLVSATAILWPYVVEKGNYSEATGGPYPHLFHILVALLVLVLVLARTVARWMLKGTRDDFPPGQSPAEILDETELFERPDKDPRTHRPTLFLAALTVPLRFPIELLFVPAAYLLLFDHGWRYHKYIAVGVLLANWFLLATADIYPRLQLREAFRRLFMFGGLWVISVFVIFVAWAWLTRFGYVHTVLEGHRWLILRFLGSLYVVFWWHEYWVNRVMSEEVLALLGEPPDDKRADYRDYPFERHAAKNCEAGTKPLHVRDQPQFIQIHGSAQLAVAGEKTTREEEEAYKAENKTDVAGASPTLHDQTADLTQATGRPATEEPKSGNEVWQFYSRSALLEQLGEHAGDNAAQAYSQLKLRIQAYFTLLNGVVILAMIGFFWLLGVNHRVAVVETRDAKPAVVSTKTLLFSDQKPPRRVIAIAASGGGTRAALYATSVLEGLRNIGAIEDVRLLSGVSGGGVSLSYFAGHRADLESDDVQKADDAWNEFYGAMKNDYIGDVLRGCTEIRIARGTVLGQLLAESFERNFWPGDTSGTRTLGSIEPNTGLILNSAVCGRFPAPFGLTRDAKNEDRGKSELATIEGAAGTRLIFTNTDCAKSFERFGEQRQFPNLPVEIVSDPDVAITTAAALNANFPPVFPNAPVDIEKNGRFQRYWVTDGGAQENLGLISLLVVLIDQLGSVEGELPELHVIAAEASAGSVVYNKNDRGIGAVQSARSQLAIGLEQLLMQELRQLYADRNQESQVKFHYLPMPSILRMGGVGTHWMLQSTLSLKAPDVAGADDDSDPIRLTGEQLIGVLRMLHPDQDEPDKNRQPSDLWARIAEDPLAVNQDDPHNHDRAWFQVRTSLKK